MQGTGKGKDHQRLSTSVQRTIYVSATRQKLMLESLLLKHLCCCLTRSCLKVVQDEVVQVLNLDLKGPATGFKRCPGTRRQLSCFARFQITEGAQRASIARLELAKHNVYGIPKHWRSPSSYLSHAQVPRPATQLLTVAEPTETLEDGLK